MVWEGIKHLTPFHPQTLKPAHLARFGVNSLALTDKTVPPRPVFQLLLPAVNRSFGFVTHLTAFRLVARPSPDEAETFVLVASGVEDVSDCQRAFR